MLLLVASAAISGCAAGRLPWSYRVRIPELRAAPIEVNCLLGGQPAECVLVLKPDWEDVVLELKAACLAVGGTPKECQAELPSDRAESL